MIFFYIVLEKTFAIYFLHIKGLAALLGSPIAGLAVDYFQSSRIALLLSTVCLSFSTSVFMLAYIQDRRTKYRMRYQEIL